MPLVPVVDARAVRMLQPCVNASQEYHIKLGLDQHCAHHTVAAAHECWPRRRQDSGSKTTPTPCPLSQTPNRALHALVQCQLQTAPNRISSAWREPHLLVLQALLDARAECIVNQLPSLVAALAAAAGEGALASSAKLAQAMMGLAAGFGAVLSREHVEELITAAAATKTFMTKGLLNKLRQLAPAGG